MEQQSGDSWVPPAKVEFQNVGGPIVRRVVMGTPIPNGWRLFTPQPPPVSPLP